MRRRGLFALYEIEIAKMIYVSSIAFAGRFSEEMVQLAKAHELPFEFSSGMPPEDALLSYFLDYPFPKLAHNYFPAPATPFVLNLASKNEEIRTRSIHHCIQGLEISKKAGAPFYAAHAGFCLDPNPDELGKKLKQSAQKVDRAAHWNIFADSVKRILAKADALEIDFYIENNVCAAMNLNIHGENPLLCSHFREIRQFMEQMKHPRLGLLLDTAHLKVSARTLSFDLEEAMLELMPYIKAIHHSDNEGLLDNNKRIDKDYWFGRFMPYFRNLPQVLEVKKLKPTEIAEQLALLRSFEL